MQRFVGLLGFIIVLAISVYLFEWQHVWQFNADRVLLLRAIFYGLSAGALVALAIGKHWWLPAVLIASSFAVAGVLSNAQISLRGISLALAFVLGIGLCAFLVRPPLIRRET
jgi:hypothetical protein